MDELLTDARRRDETDELSGFRDRFWIPHGRDGEQAYFCGHSLGLQPKAAESAVRDELSTWRERAVGGHFEGDPAWMHLSEYLSERLAEFTGALPGEVVVMNTLTVNLHLMMVSFFRPSDQRRKILIEKNAFPSDRYAVVSQLKFHGLDPARNLVEFEAQRDGLIDEESIEAWLAEHGREVALVLWPGVQYISGQAFDLRRIATAARKAGARIGFDLAHAAGNLPLSLHDSGCDFACWCNYKYLNGGPGAVAGCFVHQRHHGASLPRFEGWWGNDEDSRFRMADTFSPAAGAAAWQQSTPPILSMAPLKASLELFREAGMERLRAKSVAMTAWLQQEVESRFHRTLQIITPSEPRRRGCQLSLRVRDGREYGRSLFRFLERRGVICDWREPDVIRVAPVPLYNRYEDIFRLISSIHDWCESERSSC